MASTFMGLHACIKTHSCVSVAKIDAWTHQCVIYTTDQVAAILAYQNSKTMVPIYISTNSTNTFYTVP